MANLKSKIAKRGGGGDPKAKKKGKKKETYGTTGMTKSEFKKHVKNVRRSNREAKVTSRKKHRPSANF